MAVITEHPRMSPDILGTAVGLRTVISNTGMYFIGILGGRIVDWTGGYDATVLVVAIVISLGMVFNVLVTETGPKARARDALAEEKPV